MQRRVLVVNIGIYPSVRYCCMIFQGSGKCILFYRVDHMSLSLSLLTLFPTHIVSGCIHKMLCCLKQWLTCYTGYPLSCRKRHSSYTRIHFNCIHNYSHVWL
ncbi:uncharacterized protein EV154DRAFT_531593 [Mucor mucedo]|uniref:uncharacterized protein n=1 Tax=Mucor mucedo TaxID=29922 RepID=UPI002220279B|nr:uncharacterized protein EV154DRAFT_531593 [Mucor mucedo]KAI7867894.1 hypothetical protein EV154DRAFT_531593 [Mucor mucedo]